MQVTVNVKGMAELERAMREMSERRVAAAIATALTRSARAIQGGWQIELGQKLDRPTPFTIRSVQVRGATAQALSSTVFVRSDSPGTAPAEYLTVQEKGGQRRMRKFEAALQAQGSMPRGAVAVPGKHAKLDQYGNLTRGQIVQILAQLGAAFSPGYQRVIARGAAKRAATAIKSGRNYVAVLTQVGGMAPGVYLRGARGLLPVLFYAATARYQRRIDLQRTAEQAAPVVVRRELQKSLAEQFARLAARRA
jgi:hypothetical protein